MDSEENTNQNQTSPQTSGSAKAGNGGSEQSQQPTEEDLIQECENLRQEAAELKDKFMRTAAEMENIRRRAEREKADVIKYALENVFRDFLPVLDSLEQALPAQDEKAPKGNDDTSNASYYEGMMMVKKQLLDVFKKHGLEPIHAAGEPFNPNLHQAIQRIETNEVETDTVAQEYAKGYLLNGRLLRPAMVSVKTPSGS